nr:pilin [Acinetobacter baumannii]
MAVIAQAFVDCFKPKVVTSQINGKKIEWIRDADNATNGTTGAWRCKTDVAENLRPKSCGAS